MSPVRLSSPTADRLPGELIVAPDPGYPLSERRQHQRYPIIAQAQYIMNRDRGQALTVDISSGGVFLKTDSPLPAGEHIKVLIDWPVLLDQQRPLRLVVVGKVLRSDLAGTSVGIMRYEFRTKGQSVARLCA